MQWYAVKTIVEHPGLSDEPGAHVYEERIVLFRAESFEDAISQAEREVQAYAAPIGASYAGYCNAFTLKATAIESATEVYSVMRETSLSPSEFISRYYDDGTDKHS